MPIIRRHSLRIFILMILPLLLLCSNDYNPFDNFLNAQIRVLTEKSSIAKKDSVSIFSTETLWVYATNREKIQKFIIHADSNRLWKDDTVFCDSPTMEFRFLLSFNDVGTKSISIKTFRTNGDVSYQSQALSVRVFSPLSQKIISGVLGMPCTLSTPGVSDRVNYVWSFGTYQGKNVLYKKQFASGNEEMVQNIPVGAIDTGFLWVEDSTGAIRSPQARFLYRFDATIGPSISCISKGVRSDAPDIVVTGEDFLDFSVFIADQAGASVDSVEFVGNGFDWVNSDRTIFKKTFTGMGAYTASKPLFATVIATDKYKNTTKRTFSLYYDASGPKSKFVQFRLINPPEILAYTKKGLFDFLLGVDNTGNDSAQVSITVNGTPVNPQMTIGKSSPTLSWTIPCSTGNNTVKAIAMVKSLVYADTTITIIRDPFMVDTAKPQILDVTVDNNPVSTVEMRVSTTRPLGVIRVIAIDQISGVRSVSANNRPLSNETQNASAWSIQDFSFSHPYTPVVLSVVDSSGNVKEETFTVTENNDPVIEHPNPFPAYFYAGTKYVDTIVVEDPEYDVADLKTSILPRTMTLTSAGFNKWVLSYAPTAVDTGSKTVVFSVRDTISKEVFLNWKFMVFKDSSGLVRFQTASAVFPKVLEAGKDSILQALTVTKGYPQYHFSVAFLGSSVPLFASTVSQANTMFAWKPQLSDTGYHQLLITVKDSVGVNDTIMPLPAITVVPPNRPCSLKITHTIPMWGNSLDLTNVTIPETLFCSVIDPDLSTYDHQQVKIRFPTTRSEFTVDTTKSFIVVLYPEMFSLHGFDTVSISITDMAGHRDSVFYPILVGLKKDVIVQTVQNGISILSADVYNYPLLVRLNSGNFSFGKALGNGSDLRFTKGDGMPLPFEIERYDSSAQVAEIWVKVDTVFANNNTQKFRLLSGNNAVLSPMASTRVFDTADGYEGVWHVNDAVKGQNLNSAQNAYNATLASPPTQTSLRTGTGIIASADSFANNAYLSVGTIPTSPTITLSAWVYPVNAVLFGKILSKPWTNYVTPYLIYSLEVGEVTTSATRFYVGANQNNYAGADGDNSLPIKTWSCLTGTYDGQTLKFYYNGVLLIQKNLGTPAPAIPDNNNPWNIGSWSLNPAEAFSGKIDELRMIKKAMSADYIRLNYESQKSGSTLIKIQ